MGKGLQPEVVPIGGYNLEYRQNFQTSGGYIYSHAGADGEAFIPVYEGLPAAVSFGAADSPDALNKGVLGIGDMPISSIIYPYPGSPPPTLPLSLTLLAGTEVVEFGLIARILSMVPMYDPKNPPPDPLAMWQKGEIQRHTRQTLHTGGVLQEIVNERGERYMLVSAFGDATEQYDVNQVGGLDGLPLPKGYAYESRQIREDMTIEALEVAHIIVNSAFNFQRYRKE